MSNFHPARPLRASLMMMLLLSGPPPSLESSHSPTESQSSLVVPSRKTWSSKRGKSGDSTPAGMESKFGERVVPIREASMRLPAQSRAQEPGNHQALPGTVRFQSRFQSRFLRHVTIQLGHALIVMFVFSQPPSSTSMRTSCCHPNPSAAMMPGGVSQC